MSDFLIYALKCPKNGEFKYIGKSTSGLNRPKSHLALSHNESVRLWVEELREEGLCPLIDVIEECSQEEDLLSRERFWISYYLGLGLPLMNIIQYKGVNISKLHDELKLEEEKLFEKLNKVKSELYDVKELHCFIVHTRKQRGITQETLADLSGIGLRTIKAIEVGKGNPTYNTLIKILDVLGYEIVPCIKNIKI
jgi:DNA-binding XRE family transcriptional regulator